MYAADEPYFRTAPSSSDDEAIDIGVQEVEEEDEETRLRNTLLEKQKLRELKQKPPPTTEQSTMEMALDDEASRPENVIVTVGEFEERVVVVSTELLLIKMKILKNMH